MLPSNWGAVAACALLTLSACNTGLPDWTTLEKPFEENGTCNSSSPDLFDNATQWVLIFFKLTGEKVSELTNKCVKSLNSEINLICTCGCFYHFTNIT